VKNSNQRHTKCHKKRATSTRFCGAAALLVSSIISAQAVALDRFVDASAGVDASNCLSQASPCQTIAYAMDESNSGDIIKLGPENGQPQTYTEFGLLNPVDLTIESITNGRSIINGKGLGRIFQIYGGHLTLNNLIIEDGDAGLDIGGAVWLFAGNLVANKSLFRGNRAVRGGAIAADAAGGGSITLKGTVVQDNHASGNGGGIWCDLVVEFMRVTRKLIFSDLP